MSKNYSEHDPEELPQELKEEVEKSVSTLSRLGLWVRATKGHDIKNCPIILENSVNFEGSIPLADVEEGEKYFFRLTVQQIPKEKLGSASE